MNNHHPDKLIIFDIMGRNAHFRKFYTNSSSLSYLVPPRSVLAGLIAGMLGLPSERFTNNESEIYYDFFNSENAFISVSLKTPIRKMMQTINYSFTKTQNKEISFSKHSQIPLEILNAQGEDEIIYRVYFSFLNNEYKEKFHNSLNLIKKNKFVYPPYLGLTEFIASIKFIDEGKIERANQPAELHSVCKLENIADFNFNNKVRYLTERMPTGFTNNRTPLAPAEYLIEVNCEPIFATYKENAKLFKIEYMEKGNTISEFIAPM